MPFIFLQHLKQFLAQKRYLNIYEKEHRLQAILRNFITVSNLTYIGTAQEHMINASLILMGKKVKFERAKPTSEGKKRNVQ